MTLFINKDYLTITLVTYHKIIDLEIKDFSQLS